jgi:single-strand DNA-binding protein
MAIRTHQSISGFVASDPQLSYTERGDARLYMKVGIEHYRKEPDNSFTQLETTFHDLIAYRGAPSREPSGSPRATTSSPTATGARVLLRAQRPAVRRRGVHRDVASATTSPAPATRWIAPRTQLPARDAAAFAAPQQAAPSTATAIGM